MASAADDAAELTAKAFARSFQWSPRSETPLTGWPSPQLLDANEAAIRDKEWIGSLYTQSRNTERQLFKENEALSLQLVDLKHQHQGLLQENEALRLETADLKDDVESLQIEVEALRNELEQAGEEEGGGNTGHSQEVVDGGQAEPDVEGRINRFQRVETREASDLLYLENQQTSTVGNVYSCSCTTFVRADDLRLRRCAQRRRSFARTTRSCSRKMHDWAKNVQT